MRVARAAVCLVTLTALAGCTGGSEQPPKQPQQQWVRGAEPVEQVTATGDGYVGVQVNAQNRLVVVSLDPATGKVTHRRQIDPVTVFDEDYVGVSPVLAGNVMAYDKDAGTLDALDPKTFEKRWSYRGSLHSLGGCESSVCVVGQGGTTKVLSGEDGGELWTSKEGTVFAIGRTIISLTETKGSPHLTLTGLGAEDGKPMWQIRPTHRFANKTSGLAYRELGGKRTVFLAYDRQDRPLGMSLYDMKTGEHIWSRHDLRLDVIGERLAGFSPDYRTVHFLDPETGRDRWSAKAPSGYTVRELGVGVDGRPWLALRRAGSTTKMTYVPVDEQRRRIGAVDTDATTVMLSRDTEPSDKRVKVDGTTRKLSVPLRFRPTVAGSGEVTSWPKDAKLPADLRYGDDRHGHAIDADGYPILERIR